MGAQEAIGQGDEPGDGGYVMTIGVVPHGGEHTVIHHHLGPRLPPSHLIALDLSAIQIQMHVLADEEENQESKKQAPPWREIRPDDAHPIPHPDK